MYLLQYYFVNVLCVCGRVLFRGKVVPLSLKPESKCLQWQACVLSLMQFEIMSLTAVCVCLCMCARERERVRVSDTEEGRGNNLFITGISRNSSSTVLGISPIRHWLEREKDTEKERESMCFHPHNSEEEVQGDRGLDQHTHKHTHKQRKCEADSGPNASPTPSPGFDGLTTITIEAGGWHTHLHKQWIGVVYHVFFNQVVGFIKTNTLRWIVHLSVKFYLSTAAVRVYLDYTVQNKLKQEKWTIEGGLLKICIVQGEWAFKWWGLVCGFVCTSTCMHIRAHVILRCIKKVSTQFHVLNTINCIKFHIQWSLDNGLLFKTRLTITNLYTTDIFPLNQRPKDHH